MMSSLPRVMMWALPVSMVLLFTMGPYVMMAFAAVVGITKAVRDIRSGVAVVTAAALLTSAISPLAASATEQPVTGTVEAHFVEISVCVDDADQRGGREGEEGCAAWDSIKMALQCVVCAAGIIACPILVASALGLAVGTPPADELLALAVAVMTCGGGALACMGCMEKAFRCQEDFSFDMAKDALRIIVAATCPLKDLYFAICGALGIDECPGWPRYLC